MLYSRMRHPLYLGWALAFWATPTMTLGHLLFAGALTLYMAVAALVEERDLVSYYGDTYRAYSARGRETSYASTWKYPSASSRYFASFCSYVRSSRSPCWK